MMMTRREFMTAGILAATGWSAGCHEALIADTQGSARLRARPKSPSHDIQPGEHAIGEQVGADCRLFVPSGYTPHSPAPLLVMLHGAGASRELIPQLFPYADEHGVLMLAPTSLGRTWDLMLGGFGPDVPTLDRALTYAFDHCAVDPARLVLGGFSDGGSYALSLGLTNGDLFPGIAAFSPGYMKPEQRIGTPKVFLTHGIGDQVLPIDQTSRSIARQLRDWGYELTYHEFDGPHVIYVPMVVEALRWMVAGLPGELRSEN